MRVKRRKKSQSVLEYAVLLGVVVSAIAIMQVYVKRGVQGGLKESADKMGDAYSVSGTTAIDERTLEEDREITSETATAAGSPMAGLSDHNFKQALDKGAYSVVERKGETTSEHKQKTDMTTQEDFAWDDYDDATFDTYAIDEVE